MSSDYYISNEDFLKIERTKKLKKPKIKDLKEYKWFFENKINKKCS